MVLMFPNVLIITLFRGGTSRRCLAVRGLTRVPVDLFLVSVGNYIREIKETLSQAL